MPFTSGHEKEVIERALFRAGLLGGYVGHDLFADLGGHNFEPEGSLDILGEDAGMRLLLRGQLEAHGVLGLDAAPRSHPHDTVAEDGAPMLTPPRTSSALTGAGASVRPQTRRRQKGRDGFPTDLDCGEPRKWR